MRERTLYCTSFYLKNPTPLINPTDAHCILHWELPQRPNYLIRLLTKPQKGPRFLSKSLMLSLLPIARAGRERQLKDGTPCSLQDVIARMEARERQQRKALASIAVDMECSRLEMEVRIGQTQTN